MAVKCQKNGFLTVRDQEKTKEKRPGGAFFEVFPHKARSIGGEAVPKRRDDYATGESKRWFKSSHSDQASWQSQLEKPCKLNVYKAFCFAVSLA